MGMPFCSSMRTAPSSGRVFGRVVSRGIIDVVIVLLPLLLIRI